jgi:hypothetical protein
MEFKERAIYQLPNGRELVAYLTGANKAILYNLTASEPGEYELNSEGRLLLNGRLTAWEEDDLLDTGRIASPDVTAVLVKAAAADEDKAHEQTA